MNNYKTVTPIKWLPSLTRSVVHRRFHQQGFDYSDLMIWIGLRLWEVVDYGRWSLTRSPHVIKVSCNLDPRIRERLPRGVWCLGLWNTEFSLRNPDFKFH